MVTVTLEYKPPSILVGEVRAYLKENWAFIQVAYLETDGNINKD